MEQKRKRSTVRRHVRFYSDRFNDAFDFTYMMDRLGLDIVRTRKYIKALAEDDKFWTLLDDMQRQAKCTNTCRDYLNKHQIGLYKKSTQKKKGEK